MDRRNFLKYLSGAPLLALPEIAFTKPIAKEEKTSFEGLTHLSNSNITIHGHLILNGDQHTLNACHFEMFDNGPVIEMKNSDVTHFAGTTKLDSPLKKEFDPIGLAPIKTEGAPLYYERYRK